MLLSNQIAHDGENISLVFSFQSFTISQTSQNGSLHLVDSSCCVNRRLFNITSIYICTLIHSWNLFGSSVFIETDVLLQKSGCLDPDIEDMQRTIPKKCNNSPYNRGTSSKSLSVSSMIINMTNLGKEELEHSGIDHPFQQNGW